jgi:hypothetical protein
MSSRAMVKTIIARMPITGLHTEPCNADMAFSPQHPR